MKSTFHTTHHESNCILMEAVPEMCFIWVCCVCCATKSVGMHFGNVPDVDMYAMYHIITLYPSLMFVGNKIAP